MSRDFRYVGENGLPFEEWLVYCDNLRSVLELDRFPRDIKEGSTEWADANHLLTYLWSTYHETVNGDAAHRGYSPDPADWKARWGALNRKANEWRKAHPFNRAAFPEFRCVRK